MLWNSALDNLGEQAGVPEEGELSPRKQKALVFRECSLTRSGLLCSVGKASVSAGLQPHARPGLSSGSVRFARINTAVKTHLTFLSS